ncbi:uncharacterized protein LOC121853099 [Homarus americanus]|uniref:THAP domain-containing protein 4-like 2 n=1 Tax=Homarus americanus TaxID=6706 RepID=A0A8J5MMJ3_HOMAM|nr:uncharacterized protein LOC121853099 [Homarus americanus]KAG7157013.1 THAP domain-containing protein 4-like 2 [Homarus americanus]
MPCCAAWRCSTRPGHGKMLHRFPRNARRRREWEVKVRRENWRAKDHSFLCSDHFEEEQYESHRTDNRRQLKPNAIPTLFAFNANTRRRKLRKPPPKRCRDENDEPPYPSKVLCIDHSYASTSEHHPVDTSVENGYSDEKDECQLPIQEVRPVHEEVTQVKGKTPAISSSLMTSVKKNLNLTESMLLQRIIYLQKKLAEERREKWKMMQQKKVQQLNMAKVFNQDQLAKLGHKNTRGSKWSDETIQKGLQLLSACGTTGYSLLLSQHQPLPSLRSLRRKLEVARLEPGAPEPRMLEPEKPEPGIPDLMKTQPEIIESEIPELGIPEPGIQESTKTQSEIPEPGKPEPGAPDPMKTHPGILQSEIPDCMKTLPEIIEPGILEPEKPEPGMLKPEIPELVIPEPGIEESMKRQPEIIESGIQELGTSEPMKTAWDTRA